MSTTEQAHRALERANHVRLARAALRHRIERGEVSATEVLLHPPEEARSWSIFCLLSAQPRWGFKRAHRLLSAARISELRTIGELTERQRRALSEAVQDQQAYRRAALMLLGDREQRP